MVDTTKPPSNPGAGSPTSEPVALASESKSGPGGSGDHAPRLLIFVIAYQAESTLRRVLERIPPTVFAEYACEVLVVDDASADRTYEIGHEFRSEHPEIGMTVLRNAYNQGYGGNQKVGYHYAISNGFDIVAMVHGDGQYAPEELPKILRPIRDNVADAVFGSRMIERGAALRGGMPLYKFVGNRILSSTQNLLLGTSFSEFHSGYRAYSVAALRGIHFRLNSNDFHFDTEIILQLLNAEKKIVELPIPTYYGDEICRVDGMKYAANVMKATIGNVLHRLGLRQRRRLDPVTMANEHYDLKLGFPSSHQWALDLIQPGASVIDLGAGPGGMATELLRKGSKPAVVDQFPPQTSVEDIEVFVQDLDEPLEFDVAPYEHILMLDVIEHLRSPEQFLDRLRAQFGYTPQNLILTTPNVSFIVTRLMLLFGQFNYGSSGILDRTHTRLFTFQTITDLVEDAGFVIQRIRGVPAPVQKAIGSGPLGQLLTWVNLFLVRVSKTLFSYQIFIEATSTPSLDYIVRDNERRSDAM